MTYELEKNIWTDSDFEIMSWHDAMVYKIHLGDDLELDIDYIFKWNSPDLEGLPFTFWVAPTTLIFKMPEKVTFDLDIAFDGDWEIADIEMVKGSERILWTINTQNGKIQFISAGFEQFVRQKPTYQFGQAISYSDRYGISLERTTNQNNPNILQVDYLERRKRDFENYENFKRRHLKRQEMEKLNKSKADNKIGVKEYLLQKREIQKVITDIDLLLKGTIFES